MYYYLIQNILNCFNQKEKKEILGLLKNKSPFEKIKTLLEKIEKEEHDWIDYDEKKYKIIDHIWFNEQKWDIFQRSDDNLDKPNSWVTIVSDDIEFLNRNGLWKKENLVESRYGHLYYCSLPIEAEKFSLIRTRKNLPI